MSPYRRSCSVDLAIYECVHYPSGLPITPATVPSVLKTALCQQYVRTRRCSYGDYCKFAHSFSELRLDSNNVEDKAPEPHVCGNGSPLNKMNFPKIGEFDKAPGGLVKGRPVRPQRTLSSSSDSSTASSTSEKHYLPLFGTVSGY